MLCQYKIIYCTIEPVLDILPPGLLAWQAHVTLLTFGDGYTKTLKQREAVDEKSFSRPLKFLKYLPDHLLQCPGNQPDINN